MADDNAPAESTSQEINFGIVDSGEESFAVDNTPKPVEGKTGDQTQETLPPEEKLDDFSLDAKPEEETGETLPEEKPSDEKPGEKPEADEDEDLPKGVKKRLATVTRKRRDAERETATMRAQNQELLARLDFLEHPEARPGEEPLIDDFETEEEYLEAVSDFKAEQKIAKWGEIQREEAAEEVRKGQEVDAQIRQEALRTNLRKGVEKYDDFEEVIEDLNITGDMVGILESLPNIPEVVYTLGKSPETVAALVDLPFLQVAYKMKEISDTLVKKKTTKAPAPVRPVATSGGMIKSLEKMSQAEYNATMNKRDSERRGLI